MAALFPIGRFVFSRAKNRGSHLRGTRIRSYFSGLTGSSAPNLSSFPTVAFWSASPFCLLLHDRLFLQIYRVITEIPIPIILGLVVVVPWRSSHLAFVVAAWKSVPRLCWVYLFVRPFMVWCARQGAKSQDSLRLYSRSFNITCFTLA